MSKPVEEIIAEAIFDAHVKAGFTVDQALQITVAFINH